MNVNVGHKLRFQVLTRDRFACQYCGRRAPHVHLEVDHIVPKSQGGADTIDNLITGCYDCNRGKGRGRIGHSSIVNLPDEIDVLQAHINRLIAINEKALAIAEAVEAEVQTADRYWWEVLAGEPDYTFGESPRRMLRYFLRRLPAQALRECMDLAWENDHDPQGVRQIYRLAWRELEKARD